MSNSAIYDLNTIQYTALNFVSGFKRWMTTYRSSDNPMVREGDHIHQDMMDAWNQVSMYQDKLKDMIIDFQENHKVWIYFHKTFFEHFKNHFIDETYYKFSNIISTKNYSEEYDKVQYYKNELNKTTDNNALLAKIKAAVTKRDEELKTQIENMNNAVMTANELQSYFYKLHSAQDEIDNIKKILK